MMHLRDLLAKVGWQKTKNIPAANEEGESPAARFEDVLPLLDLLTHDLRYTEAVEAARRSILVRELGCGSPLCVVCGRVVVVERIFMPGGYPVRVTDFRVLLQNDPYARAMAQRAFNPWWVRRPWWWPLG